MQLRLPSRFVGLAASVFAAVLMLAACAGTSDPSEVPDGGAVDGPVAAQDTLTFQDVGSGSCLPGDVRGCNSTGLGICATGEQSCDANNTWGACQPGTPLAEDCNNNLDDDCDGHTDKADADCQACSAGDTQPCVVAGAKGICRDGQKSCDGSGVWGACAAGQAQTEDCNNTLDDDCDGLIDGADSDCFSCQPGQTRACTAAGQLGICAMGQETCGPNGSWGACQPGQAATEVCSNGDDDDCDGQVDGADSDCGACTPNQLRPCTTSSPGICRDGTQTCTSAKQWGPCQAPSPGSQQEICGDGLDNDCDGQQDLADGDCQRCSQGAVQSCIHAVASCSHLEGQQSCVPSGSYLDWGSCTPRKQLENTGTNACDGEDDDCDGIIDNGSFLRYPVRTAEWIHGPTATQMLGTPTTTSLLLMNTGNSTSQLAVYDWGANNNQGLMRGASRDARGGLNGLIKSGPTFTSNPVGSTYAATVYVPAGFSSGGAAPSTSDDLWIIKNSELHRIQLATGLHEVGTVSSIGLKSSASGGGVLSTGVIAATYLPVGALPGGTSAYFLFVGTANRCWVWDSQNQTAGFQGPTTISDCLCPAGSTGCPSDSFATAPDSLAYVGKHTLLAFRGDTVYVGALKTNSAGAFYFAWTPTTFGSAGAQYTFTCQQ